MTGNFAGLGLQYVKELSMRSSLDEAECMAQEISPAVEMTALMGPEH